VAHEMKVMNYYVEVLSCSHQWCASSRIWSGWTRPNHYPACSPLCFRVRCFACKGASSNKIKLTLTSLLLLEWAALITFLISGLFWVLDNFMTKSSCCFWKCNRNSGHKFS
jgi:hypothetical protein